MPSRTALGNGAGFLVLVATALALVVILAVVVRPAFLASATGVMALALPIAVLRVAARLRRAPERKWGHILVLYGLAGLSFLVGAVATLLLVGIKAGDNGVPRSQAPFLREDPLSRPDPPTVRAIAYQAVLRYEDEVWRRRESIRIPRSLMSGDARGGVQPARLPEGLLGRAWDFNGERGPKRQFYSYIRISTVGVRIRTYPLLTENEIELPVITSRYFEPVLVPSDGSKVEIRGPMGLVPESDPSGPHRAFASEDILTLTLDGLEDDPDRRKVRLQVANAVGRTDVYQELRDVTAVGVLQWIIPLIAGAVVGFFTDRFLKKRFEGPTSQATAQAA